MQKPDLDKLVEYMGRNNILLQPYPNGYESRYRVGFINSLTDKNDIIRNRKKEFNKIIIINKDGSIKTTEPTYLLLKPQKIVFGGVVYNPKTSHSAKFLAIDQKYYKNIIPANFEHEFLDSFASLIEAANGDLKSDPIKTLFDKSLEKASRIYRSNHPYLESANPQKKHSAQVYLLQLSSFLTH